MRFFILVCFILLIKKIILANASPYEESFLYKTGNIIAIPKKNIQVLDEKLLIKIIDDDHCKVEVDYTFYNNHKSEKVDIAFPVDYAMTDQHSVTNYSISVNNKIINYSSKKTDGDSVIYEEPQPFSRKYDQYKTKTSKIHFLSSINFIQKKKIVVHIEYVVKNDFLDWESSKSLFPTFSLRKFRYDLSPARFWGNGKTNNIQITIDASNLQDSISIKNWDHFKHVNYIYTFSQKNFQYKKNQVLKFQYFPQKLEKIYLEKQIPSSKIKSTSHNISALFDRDLNTIWKGKVNVPLVINLDTISPHRFSVATIINDIQNKHSGIKKMTLGIEYTYYHQDSVWTETTYENSSNMDTLRFRDFSYPVLNPKRFSRFTNELCYDLPFNDKGIIRKVSKITITVLEVHDKKDYFVLTELFITN